MPNVHIVSVSGGASSAATLLRVVERYPAHEIKPVFADTLWEHPDLYRFIDDLESLVEIPIVRLRTGQTPADVSTAQKMIFNSRVAKCTQVLKTKPIERYVKQFVKDGYTVYMHIGFNMRDRYGKATVKQPYGRLPAPVANWQRLGVRVKYPLWFYPHVTDPQAYCTSYGLTLPEPYRLQKERPDVFITNNCYGGCFKAGVKYWRGLLLTYPDVYEERMRWENEMRSQDKYAPYAILTKTENGVKRAYPLVELKADTERLTAEQARRQLMIDDIESDCIDECQVF